MKMFCAIFLLSSIAAAADVHVKMDAFSGKTAKEIKLKVVSSELKVKNGETFKVSLESNPSTGYSWRMLSDTGPVELATTPNTVPARPADATPPIVGAPGEQVFVFKATTAGQQVMLVFTYGRAWEGIGDQCYQVKVEVVE